MLNLNGIIHNGGSLHTKKEYFSNIIRAFYVMDHADLQHFTGKTSTFRNFTPDILPLYEGLLDEELKIREIRLDMSII